MQPPGDLIREARRAAGLTQAQLASRANTTQSAIARLESGRTSPTVANLDRVLRAAGRRLELSTALPPIDATLVWESLRRTPLERLRHHDSARRSIIGLARAARRAA